MNILLSVNIIAVIGTSLLMMAVAIVWFSSSVFGEQWLRAIGKTSATAPRSTTSSFLLLVLTFLSYAVLVCALSCLVLIGPLLSIPLFALACAVCAFVLALLALHTLWEERSLTYYAIYAGYAAVFIFGSMTVLQYWPW